MFHCLATAPSVMVKNIVQGEREREREREGYLSFSLKMNQNMINYSSSKIPCPLDGGFLQISYNASIFESEI